MRGERPKSAAACRSTPALKRSASAKSMRSRGASGGAPARPGSAVPTERVTILNFDDDMSFLTRDKGLRARKHLLKRSQFLVTPEAIDFGTLQAGDPPVELSITIQNLGSSTERFVALPLASKDVLLHFDSTKVPAGMTNAIRVCLDPARVCELRGVVKLQIGELKYSVPVTASVVAEIEKEPEETIGPDVERVLHVIPRLALGHFNWKTEELDAGPAPYAVLDPDLSMAQIEDHFARSQARRHDKKLPPFCLRPWEDHPRLDEEPADPNEDPPELDPGIRLVLDRPRQPL